MNIAKSETTGTSYVIISCS